MQRLKTTAENIQKLIDEGYGQGEGQFYKPWIPVRRFSSRGRAHRPRGWKTHRVHELHSDGEMDCFLMFEWSDNITDIREQFPLLPVEATVHIAKKLGIKHPVDSRTKHPIVMTSDFFLTQEVGHRRLYLARTYKYAQEINDARRPRLFEKFEIERIFWQIRGIDWGIITNEELPPILVANLRLLHRHGSREQNFLASAAFHNVELWLQNHLVHESLALRFITSECDRRFKLELISKFGRRTKE